MRNFLATFFFGLNHINFVISTFVESLNEQQQYKTYPLNIGSLNFKKYDDFSYGIWSSYLPLSTISQVGLIGMFDSHCYLQNSIIENTSKEINLLYYDCIDQQTHTVQKRVSFLSSDNQIHNYKFEIDPLMYENYWYFFGLNIIPSEGSFRFYIFQGQTTIASEEFSIEGPFKDIDLKVVVGGGLIVEQSQRIWIQEISKLSYFPGQLAIFHPTKENQLEIYKGFDYFKTQSTMYNSECSIVMNQKESLPDFDIFKLNHEVFASENKNCDEFQFETWIKISDFHQEDQSFIYQLIKISTNFENNYARDENLSAFQLFYELSNSQINLIVTTYSLTFPLVDYDFSKKGFLLTKEWSLNNIKLWHFLYVSLSNNILKIEITFYEGFGQTIYENQFLVNQFHEVQFKLQVGNLLQSSTNYLTGILKNMKFIHYASDANINKGCHHSCKECEGPTNKDCLSCSEESNRIYLSQYKVCVCPFDYIDDLQCMSLENYYLSIDQEFEYHSTSYCPQGYFNIDGVCQRCPSFIKDIVMTCLECIQNPKGWQNNLYCQTNLEIHNNESPAQYQFDNLQSFFIFDGIDLKPCQFGLNQDLDQIEKIYSDFEVTNKNFLKFYSSSNLNLDYYSCTLENCQICIMLITKQICQKCQGISKLRNGICVETFRIVNQINNCTAPYYITSENNCNLCEIENCQFCFEYARNDLTKSTLYSEFEVFQKDEFLTIGCSLCLEGFIFDFTLGKCIYKGSALPNCLRSFINQSGQELCTLSANQDFGVAPEIINCQRYIPNCKQCIQTPQSIVKCIICEDGYSSSLTTGHCSICQVKYAKFCIEGDYIKQDAWIQQIQSFLMQFLPNKYMYPKSDDMQYMTSLAIKCIDHYEKNDNECKLYCDQNCVSCQKQIGLLIGFICSKCQQDYYMKPLKTLENGQCISCPLLCSVCEQRTTEEIQNINPEYEINDKNRIYTYKCIQQRQDKNIIIDPYQQITKYCLNDICDNLIQYQINNNCYDLQKVFDEKGGFSYYFNYEYFNQIGAQRFKLTIPIQDFCPQQQTQVQSITNKLKKNIFSLFWVELTFLGNHSPATYQPRMKLNNFDSISLNQILYIIQESLELYIDLYDVPTNLILTDSKFVARNQDVIKLSFQVEKCQHFEIRNVTLSDLNILDSIVFKIRFQNQDNSIKLENFTIRNCNLSQTTIFQFYDFPKNTIIQNFQIENCNFYNSTIFSFISDIKQQSVINLHDFNIRESLIYNSQLINGTDTYQFTLVEISLNLNKFEDSTFLRFQNSLIIRQLNLRDCQLAQSFLFYKLLSSTQSNNLSINQFDIQNNVLINTSLIFTEQQSTLNQVVIKLQNIYLLQNGIPNAQNSSAYLFFIICFSLEIKKFEIIDSYHLQYFFLLSVSLINVEDLLYSNTIQRYRVPTSIKCLEVEVENSQLFYISGCLTLSLTNIVIINQYSIDQSFIQILQNSSVTNQRENIKLKGLNFKGNIILKKNLGLILSQLAIQAEKNQIIEIENINFQDNSFNQLVDDPSKTSSSLLFINSQSSSLYISHLTSQRNALTNSTNSFIYINTNYIKINNIFINNHNQLIQSFWNKYFNIDLNESFNQEIVNQMINKAFTIQNKGGALVVATENFIVDNCFFKEILAQSSSILDIVTQGVGKVIIKNCFMESAQNIFAQIGENDGAISIYSKNSLLQFKFHNITLEQIQNRLTSSILSIIPSLKANVIVFQNIVIKNCYSLVNQFMKIEFSLINLKSNIVSMRNIFILQDEKQLVQYFQKMESITIYEIQKITQDNAIINLQGCNLSIYNLTFQGILLSPVLQVFDSQTVQLANLQIFGVQSFYPINMINIGQTSSLQFQVVIQNIQMINLVSYDFSKLQPNINEYSRIQLEYKGCIIKFQLLNQNLNDPIKIAWIFEQILHLSSKKGSFINIQSIHPQNRIKLISILISNNNCSECWNGIIQFDLTSYFSIQIHELQCLQNKIRNYGCIYTKSQNQQESNIMITNSYLIMNNGTIGSAIMAENVRITLVNLKLLNNIATYQGGALYLSMNSNEFKISQTILYNNTAQKGGGIYLHGNSKLTKENFVKSWMKLNSASLLPNNLQEMPTHLVLSINNFEMKTIEKKTNNVTTYSLLLQPYLVMEQGKVILTKLLIIPSNQEIINFKIYNPSLLKFDNYFEEFSLSYKNSLYEILPNFSNSSCEVFRQTLFNDTLIDSTNIATIEYHSESKKFDLSFLSITIDPYQENNYINQLQIICQLDDQVDTLLYNIEIKGLMCQLGEFYVQSGCQICQPSQGYYSVTYNTTKCSIFDQNKFESVTSNQIQLKKGYWRPDYQSDYTEHCFKFVDFCKGGWVVSDDLCVVGHIGGLCEECDQYNIRGLGNYFKNEINSSCQDCRDASNSILPFVLTSIWAIISALLTLRSIDKSNKLFSSLKIRQRYVKIIFKLNQDHESILLKQFLNYVWIFSIIFTFNFQFSFSFTFINQTSNTSYFMANNLDCYLSEVYNIYLIYNKIITMIILMVGQLLIIYMGFKGYSVIKNQKFNSSLISTTLLYLYVSNYAALIKQLFSLLAKRVISNIEYISGDVSLLYNSPSHKNWIIGFVIPGLGLIGFLLPSLLFLLLYIQREKLDKIQFRRHICYLFNEYNNENYFWEWIKLWKKTIIIIIMTYFETNIFIKTSLLGLCLLLYQLYAVKQKPYILKNLNELDVSTGQICSIAIFLASIKYISEQQENKFTSVLIEMILVILCLKLSYPFFIALLRVYYKKYKISLLSNLYEVLKFINCNLSLTLYFNRKLNQMKQREQKLKTNLIKLRIHLLQISKFQLESQKSLLNLLNSQTSSRQTLLGLEQHAQKMFKLDKN